MDRRQFATLVAGAAVAVPNGVSAQSVDFKDCHYLSTVGTVTKMMLSAMRSLPSDVGPAPELGFGVFRLSAVADAGYSVLNEHEPLPGFETSHQLLLDSLEAIADTEDDMKRWITNSDVTALTQGGNAVLQAMDLFVEASNAVRSDALAWESSTQVTSVRPTRTSVAGVSESPLPRATLAPATSGVTLTNFNRLHEGMSYQEVVSILGSSGELLSSSDPAGIETEMYQWEGVGSLGANMNAMFQNGRLVSKAQFGLE